MVAHLNYTDTVSRAPETLSVTVSLKSLHYLLVLLSQYDE